MSFAKGAVHRAIDFVKTVGAKCQKDGVVSLGAALAFYTVVSLPALILTLIAIMSVFLRSEDVQNKILIQAEQTLGSGAKEIVQNIVAQGASSKEDVLRVVVGGVLLFFTITGVFGHLQNALNQIWDVAEKKTNWKERACNKLLGFGAFLFVGVLLAAYSILGALIGKVDAVFSSLSTAGVVMVFFINIGFGILVLSFLFAVLFKFLPNVKLRFIDTWKGGFITAMLFIIGQSILGVYFRFANAGSSFGVTGSLIIILLWIYYSAQILLLGAEITQVYAKRVLNL